MLLIKEKTSGLAYKLNLNPSHKRISALLLSTTCETETTASISL